MMRIKHILCQWATCPSVLSVRAVPCMRIGMAHV